MRFIYLIPFTILIGCANLELSLSSPVSQDFQDFEWDSLGYVTSNDVLERAYRMATIEWTPVNPIPTNDGRYYSKGQVVKGVPYSSVKEINTYLFQDVSYHTFMTAVHNPKSVLYTENISKAPYHGSNCASYYGAVCSSAVMYALGIDIPYYANQLNKLPFMKKLENQAIDSLKICDVIWKSGHVQMIYELDHRADTLYRITTFESSRSNAHFVNYSKEQFKKMWEDDGYVGYRYTKLYYSRKARDFKGFDPVIYNDDLCPSKGDRSVYRTTDTVTIDIFNLNYDNIVLRTDSITVASDDYKSDVYKYHDLLPGIYFVYLQNNGGKTSEVSFEVIETDVSYSTSDDDESIIVYFHSSAKPEYAALCDLPGNSLCYPISSDDEGQGYITVPKADWSEYYCKVVFRGKYGCIINNPIRVY